MGNFATAMLWLPVCHFSYAVCPSQLS